MGTPANPAGPVEGLARYHFYDANPAMAPRVEGERQRVDTAIQDKNANRKVLTVALAAIALIFGAVSAVLIATSGGPVNAAGQVDPSFVAGCIFGLLAAGALGYNAFYNIQASRHNKRQRAELLAMRNEVAAYDEIYDHLVDTEGDRVIRQGVCLLRHHGILHQIILEMTSRETMDARILDALVLETDLQRGVLRGVSGAPSITTSTFAREMLGRLYRLNEIEEGRRPLVEGETVDNFFTRLDARRDPALLACYPERYAGLVQDANGTESFNGDVFNAMNADQKQRFLVRLAESENRDAVNAIMLALCAPDLYPVLDSADKVRVLAVLLAQPEQEMKAAGVRAIYTPDFAANHVWYRLLTQSEGPGQRMPTAQDAELVRLLAEVPEISAELVKTVLPAGMRQAKDYIRPLMGRINNRAGIARGQQVVGSSDSASDGASEDGAVGYSEQIDNALVQLLGCPGDHRAGFQPRFFESRYQAPTVDDARVDTTNSDGGE